MGSCGDLIGETFFSHVFGLSANMIHRYKRPSWSTGLFVALACIVAALGGIMMFTEGKKVKKVEGVPTPVAQRLEDSEALVFGEKKKGSKVSEEENKAFKDDVVLEQEVSRS